MPYGTYSIELELDNCTDSKGLYRAISIYGDNIHVMDTGHIVYVYGSVDRKSFYDHIVRICHEYGELR